MKVVHLSCVAPPEIGGIGRVAATEVELLRARGIEADIVSLSTQASARFGNTGFVYALEHFVRDADIVHLHYPFYGTQEIAAWLKLRKKIKRLVVTLHMDAVTGSWKDVIAYIHRSVLQTSILRLADVLLVASKDYIAHSSYAKFAAQAIELPFGVDEVRFCPGPSHRDLFSIPSGAKVVTFVGGMDLAHPFKGVDVLLQAITELPPNTHVLLVGDGVLKKSYEDEAKRLGIGQRCHFVGKLASDEELVEAYRAGDVFAFPSTSGAEAFGLVALEAQACGIPVVSSALPGVRTVVLHEKTGLLVPPRDPKSLAVALSRVLEDGALHDRMSVCARQRVIERFTWHRHADGLAKMYETLAHRDSHQ